MLAAERHALILRQVERGERASVEELASALSTSTATVRRDLSRLQEAGLLHRVHGGAVVVFRHICTDPRHRDAIILAGQLVMPLVARQLAIDPIRLIVVSNQLEIARTLLGKPGIEVILLGGKVHPAGYTLPQPLGASDLRLLVSNKAFVEVEGVHGTAGLTATGAEDAQFERELLQHALQKIVVAPARRWGLVFTHRIALGSGVDVWITTALEPAQREAAATLGCEIVESVP